MLEEVIVSRGEDGWRLDTFLAEKAPPWISRSAIQKAIKDSKVFVDGSLKKPGYRVKAGERVKFDLPDKPKADPVEPEEIPLRVLYEDQDMVVLNKDPGIIVHPLPNRSSGTLVNALLYRYRDLAGLESTRPGIVHRLDKDTSGVMVVARTERALLALSAQFRERLIHKEYLALVRGKTPPSGRVEVSIGRHPVNRLKMTVKEDGKESLTRFRTLANFAEFASLVLVSPRTGRTHQIRVHMKESGHPLLGDRVYSRSGGEELYGVKRQMLHAMKLTLFQPSTGERVTFIAPLPSDMKEVIANLAELVKR